MSFWKNLLGIGPYDILVMAKEGSTLAREAKVLGQNKFQISVLHDLPSACRQLDEGHTTLFMLDADSFDKRPAELIFDIRKKYPSLRIAAVGEMNDTRRDAFVSAGANLAIEGSFSSNRKAIKKECRQSKMHGEKPYIVGSEEPRRSGAQSGEAIRYGRTFAPQTLMTLEAKMPESDIGDAGKDKSPYEQLSGGTPPPSRKVFKARPDTEKQAIVKVSQDLAPGLSGFQDSFKASAEKDAIEHAPQQSSVLIDALPVKLAELGEPLSSLAGAGPVMPIVDALPSSVDERGMTREDTYSVGLPVPVLDAMPVKKATYVGVHFATPLNAVNGLLDPEKREPLAFKLSAMPAPVRDLQYGIFTVVRSKEGKRQEVMPVESGFEGISHLSRSVTRNPEKWDIGNDWHIPEPTHPVYDDMGKKDRLMDISIPYSSFLGEAVEFEDGTRAYIAREDGDKVLIKAAGISEWIPKSELGLAS